MLLGLQRYLEPGAQAVTFPCTVNGKDDVGTHRAWIEEHVAMHLQLQCSKRRASARGIGVR